MSRLMRLVVGFVLLSAFVLAGNSAAQESTETVGYTTTAVRTHPSQGDVVDVEGGQAELFSTEAGITMNLRTSGLEEGHIYTAWWVVINNPENCSASPCAPDDVLGNVDGVVTEVTYADGILVTEDREMEFAAALAAGEVPEAWFGNGLTNPMGAEIHIVIQDHGTAIPEIAGDMLNSLRAGCTDESVPAPYPDIAKADGEPGPNTCKLVQFAVFQQEM
jgi:hypothetical protein